MSFVNNLEKIQLAAEKISDNRYLKAVSKGMVMTIPASITGAMLTLIANMPFDGYQEFIQSNGLKTLLLLPGIFTSNIMGLIVVYFIAFNLAKSYKIDGMFPGFLAIVSFLILTPLATVEQQVHDTVRPVDFISFDFIGSRGMFVGIIVGLTVAKLYSWFIKNNITIRMPDSVPSFVEKSFSSIIPFFSITFLMACISWGFSFTSYGSAHNLVYSVLQVPIQQIGGSIGGVMVAYALIGLFWWFGIHGKAIIFGVYAPILQTMTIENMNAAAAGTTPPNLIDFGFTSAFLEIGGGGCVLGLAICFVFFAKSEQYKSVGRITSIPTFFGINEPITFGTPVCLNPMFLLPTVITPLVTGLIGYVSITTGLMPRMVGAQLPTGTPTFVNAVIAGGWRMLLAQIVCVIVATAIYFPFFKMADNVEYKREQEAQKEQTVQMNIGAAVAE
ncbi:MULTISPECIES: PTS sugar transporter subunit IIC [Enterococcus]|uniref:PTS sugar transporter subunit IIC n=1 Tax=Enterococcus TaxID=1350 RepID=UPI000A3566CC|nr:MULTISPECIES: PTS transporter subunit EIIC [Enterococcus]NKD31270.1 PTS sugar transporter subunit IIC [Enterococcus casseliflavus]OTO15672.1 PTS system, cellobiose-specific IIC component [Enterococcus sp. 3G6_DIV0642]